MEKNRAQSCKIRQTGINICGLVGDKKAASAKQQVFKGLLVDGNKERT